MSGDGIVAVARADEERVLAKAAEILAFEQERDEALAATIPVQSGRG
jgi:regulator of RNase E activity RraA